MPAIKDLTGKVYGELIVIERDNTQKGEGSFWICKCNCGKTKIIQAARLVSGDVKCCGDKKAHLRRNLKGMVFGRWTVLKLSKRRRYNQYYWKCCCECGTIKYIRGSALTSGMSKSCGCLAAETTGRVNLKPYGESAKNQVFRRYQREAIKRKFSFNLSLIEFENITNQRCHYCGISPSNVNKNRRENGDFIYNGIDRVDNSKGYSIDNCVPCCKKCNRIKYKDTKEEFLAFIKRAYEFQKEQGLI